MNGRDTFVVEIEGAEPRKFPYAESFTINFNSNDPSFLNVETKDDERIQTFNLDYVVSFAWVNA